MLSGGVHRKIVQEIRIVQEILGHAQITMTLDTYSHSHVLPRMQEQAVDAMNGVLDPRSEEQ